MNELNTTLVTNTRRSAGLPFCILGIVHADRTRALLKSTMSSLLKLAEDSGAASSCVDSSASQIDDVPQVHAMNILRRLFSDTRLSSETQPWIESGLMLSLSSFTSPK